VAMVVIMNYDIIDGDNNGNDGDGHDGDSDDHDQW
jgi:hypothetical protein